jgi:hypothetical protein
VLVATEVSTRRPDPHRTRAPTDAHSSSSLTATHQATTSLFPGHTDDSGAVTPRERRHRRVVADNPCRRDALRGGGVDRVEVPAIVRHEWTEAFRVGERSIEHLVHSGLTGGSGPMPTP